MSIHESVKAGLDSMSTVEPAVVSLIVSTDVALCRDVQRPRAQCHVTELELVPL